MRRVIARKTDDANLPEGLIPIVYLPGVGRREREQARKAEEHKVWALRQTDRLEPLAPASTGPEPLRAVGIGTALSDANSRCAYCGAEWSPVSVTYEFWASSDAGTSRPLGAPVVSRCVSAQLRPWALDAGGGGEVSNGLRKPTRTTRPRGSSTVTPPQAMSRWSSDRRRDFGSLVETNAFIS